MTNRHANRQPTRVIHGMRAAREGKIRLGCSAILFSADRSKVLLTRRSDNGQWCLPGGMVDPGESVTETCQREVSEETGLDVRVRRLVGIYSNPDMLVVYPDGNRAHTIVLSFEVEVLTGEPTLSAETLGIDHFPVAKALEMDLFHGHVQHLKDALEFQEAAFIR
jgi:ADP-ribose pyrophosphatase YjhB (NUDIX family)